jgi:LuxR family quorum sensing-dependent transcriptional regulator
VKVCDGEVGDGLLCMKFNEDLLQGLQSATTEDELALFLQRLTAEFGFRFFSIFDIPATFSDRLSRQIRLSNLPPEYIEEYDTLGLLTNSSVFASLRKSTAPMTRFLDAAVKERPTKEQKAMKTVFEKYQMTMGVYYPVHGPNGRRAAMGFFGDRLALTHTEMGELGIFVLHAYDAYSNLKNKTKTEANGITARELEVLHWAANGKTSTEIAAILSLSDHTVNTYMNSAMRKLDCVNRTQLVAKALRLHLIS